MIDERRAVGSEWRGAGSAGSADACASHTGQGVVRRTRDKGTVRDMRSSTRCYGGALTGITPSLAFIRLQSFWPSGARRRLARLSLMRSARAAGQSSPIAG